MKPGQVKTFCQNCHMKCRIFVTVSNGKVQKITSPGDMEGAKSTPAYEEVTHSERVIYPLKRKGQRGGAHWDRISWDEALDTMAEKFAHAKEHYGVDAVGTLRG